MTCLRNGMPEVTLAALMGHSDTSMLRQYLPLNDNDLWQAHQKYEPTIGLPLEVGDC